MDKSFWSGIRHGAFILILLALSTDTDAALAQQISGQVKASNGTPLASATVYLPRLQEGAVTDRSGFYVLDGLPPDTLTVTFSFIGFERVVKIVDVRTAPIQLNIVMAPEVIRNEEVLVEEDSEDALTRNIRSMDVLEAEALEDIRGQTLGETLAELPGISTLQTGPAISKPVIRGLHSQRVIVLNAGVVQEGQQWGGEHAPEIDPFAPVRIEVIKGVSGVEYGVGAIGGVIRLEPEPLPFVPGEPLKGRLSLNGFSNNGQGAASLFVEGASGSIAGLGWRAQGSFRKAGDARTPDMPITNSGFQENNGSFTLGLQRNQFSWTAHLSHFGTELGIFCGSHFGNLNDFYRAIGREQPLCQREFGYQINTPKQQIAHDLATFKTVWRREEGDRFEVQYGIQRNNRKEFDSHRGGLGNGSNDNAAFDLTLLTHSFDMRYNHRPIGNAFGTIGFSGTNQLNQNDASGFLIPNFRALTGGVFARESLVLNQVTLEAGLRYDYRWVQAWPRERISTGPFVRIRSSYSSLSAALGAIWTLTPEWSLALNAGTAWRPPSVNELYNFGVHHGTAQFEIGDQDLGPERSLSTDVTLRRQSENVRLEVSGYINRFQGFIYLFPAPDEEIVTIRGTFPVFRYQQNDALLKGLDGRVEWDAFSSLGVHVQGSTVIGDNLDTEEPLFQMPANRLHLGFEWHLPQTKVFQDSDLDVESVWVARQSRFPRGDFLDPPKGYHLLNVSLGTLIAVQKSEVRLNLSVNNLLNTAYRDYLSRFRYFIDDPGRTVVLRLSLPIGPS